MAKGTFILIEDVEGKDKFIARLKAMETALLEAAPKALEEASKIPIDMMKRQVRVDTGKLKESIRFTLGKRGGAPKSVLRRRGQGIKKTSVTAYIVAGDKSTLVKGKGGVLFQNARLQEFGTVNMEAKPYFFVSWRARRKEFQRAVNLFIKRAMKGSKAAPGPMREAA